MSKRKPADSRTSLTVRQAIHESPDSLRVLAARFGINLKTAAKWKRRADVNDLPSGPKNARRGSLTVEEEEIVVGFRRKTLLPLDDCLYSLQARIPGLSRSTLHRCLVRHGLNRLPENAQQRRDGRWHSSAFLGCLDFDTTTTATADGAIDVQVAMDRASRFVFLDTATRIDEELASCFLRKVAAEAPFAVRAVYVPWSLPFVRIGAQSAFSTLCNELEIDLREARLFGTGPRTSLDALDWREGAVNLESRAAFEARLQDFVHAYNYRRRLKTLRGLTPFEFAGSGAVTACTMS